MKSSLADTQDRILKSFSHNVKGSSANSAVAVAIELGKRNPSSFKERSEEMEFSFANPEDFKSFIKAKKEAEAAKRNNKKKKK